MKNLLVEETQLRRESEAEAISTQTSKTEIQEKKDGEKPNRIVISIRTTIKVCNRRRRNEEGRTMRDHRKKKASVHTGIEGTVRLETDCERPQVPS